MFTTHCFELHHNGAFVFTSDVAESSTHFVILMIEGMTGESLRGLKGLLIETTKDIFKTSHWAKILLPAAGRITNTREEALRWGLPATATRSGIYF